MAAPTTTTPTPAGEVSDLELVTAIADALDGAIADLDTADPPLAPISQLAVIAVGVLRGVAPLVRREADEMAAKVAASNGAGQ